MIPWLLTPLVWWGTLACWWVREIDTFEPGERLARLRRVVR